MKDIFKKIIMLIAAIVIVIGVVVYSLKPSNPINNKDRLYNIDERIDVAQMNKKVIKSINLQNDGAVVDMQLNNYAFKKLLKYNVVKYGKRDFEAYVFNLEGDKLLVQIPKKLGPFRTQIDVLMSIGNNKDNLILSVDSVKIGKVKLPKNIINNKLDSMIYTGIDRISSENGKIYINLNSVDFDIRRIYIKDGALNLKLNITKDDIKKIGVGIIDNLFDF